MKISPAIPLSWLLLAAVPGCHDQVDQSRPANNATSQAPVGGELRISEDAQVAIGLTTASVEQREVRGVIQATGWLAARPASEVVLKAPTTGFIVPSEGFDYSLGQLAAKDQRLAELEVFLSPQEQAQLVAAKEETDIQIQQSLATLKLNEEQLKRAETAAPDAIAGTRLLELREIVAHSRAAEQEAREKLPYLPGEPYGKAPRLKTVAIDAPFGGRLVAVHFAPRQLVVAGDPLWTVVDWSRLWIRLPVYVADLSRIVQDEPADVVVPGVDDVRQAQPVYVPQGADPGKQTVELFYEIDNTAGGLRPGQAVSVYVPSGAQALEVVIPRSAILWDGMGNSWVYVRTSPVVFCRQKVEVGQAVQDNVVVRRGLNQGETVVTVGAEALYGEEFKGQIQLEEEEGERD